MSEQQNEMPVFICKCLSGETYGRDGQADPAGNINTMAITCLHPLPCIIKVRHGCSEAQDRSSLALWHFANLSSSKSRHHSSSSLTVDDTLQMQNLRHVWVAWVKGDVCNFRANEREWCKCCEIYIHVTLSVLAE